MAPVPHQRRTWFGLALVLTAAIVAFSAGFRRPPPSFVDISASNAIESAPTLEGDPDPLFQPDASMETPRFIDEGIREQVHVLRGHAATGATHSWHHAELRRRGNFLRERWCSPSVGSTRCSRPGLQPLRPGDPSLFELDLVRDLETPPSVVGFRYRARRSAAAHPWSLDLNYSQGGGDIAGHGLGISFVRNAGDGSTESLTMGTVYDLHMGTRTCRIHAPGLPTDDHTEADRAARAELALLIESPTALRDTVGLRLDRLVDAAEAALLGRTGTDADAECNLEGMSEEEAALWLSRVRSTVSHRRELLEANYVTFHGQLSSAVPAPIVAD